MGGLNEKYVAQIENLFGILMPGRSFGSDTYRFGFNGKENDSEVKRAGNQQDYGFRIYDTRIGKFLSVDPLTKDYPWYTPYQFAGNKPIACVDIDGLEDIFYRVINIDKESGAALVELFVADKSNWNSNKGKLRIHHIETASFYPEFPFESIGSNGGLFSFDELFDSGHQPSEGKHPFVRGAEPGQALNFSMSYYFGLDATKEALSNPVTQKQFYNDVGELKFYSGLFEVMPTMKGIGVGGNIDNISGASLQTQYEGVLSGLNQQSNQLYNTFNITNVDIESVQINLGSDVLNALGEEFKNDLQSMYPNAEVTINEIQDDNTNSNAYGILIRSKPLDITR